MHRSLLPFLFLFTVSFASGQNPAQPSPVIPLPPVVQPSNPPAIRPPRGVPGPAAQAPLSVNLAEAAPAATTVPPAASETVRMQYPNSDVKEVLALYERLTQKKLVYDNLVQGPVNIVISTPVSRAEAIQIIEINLQLNGFTLVPASDPGILKVIGANKNARSAGLPILSDFDQLPEGERVVTFVFKLRYVDPQELQPLLAQYISPGSSTSLLALPKSQMLLVTENTSVIRGLAKIIREIDIPPAEVISEFIPLERADAKDVIEKLEKIFEKKEAQGAASARLPGNQPPVQVPGVPQEGAAPTLEIQARTLSEDSVVAGKIKLTADIRTNRIHVITRPENLPFVRKLIHEFDLDVPFGEPSKRRLRYVSASDVLDILVKAITEPGMKSEDSGGTSQKGGSSNTKSNNSGGNGGMGGTGSSLNVSEELTATAVDTTPRAVTVGNTKIIADPRENTIIVLGNMQVQQKLFKLLDEIDVRAPQVTLNTVIGEFSLSDDKNLGVDYLFHPNNPNATGTSGISMSAIARRWALTQFTGAGVLTDAASSLGAGKGITGVLSPTENLDVIVNALESTGRFRVTNRPMIVARNNEKAIVASGEQIAVPSSTLSNVNTGTTLNNTASVSASVQYQPVELKLEVVPLINSDREVSLDIVQKLDSDSGKTTNVGGSLIPTITTRYIKTKVSVPDRCTVVLGGLIKKSTQDGAAGVPLISRIPVLGYLFKNTTKNNDREELIILIRPVVTNSPAEQIKNSQDEQRHLFIEPNVESTLVEPTPKPASHKLFK